MEKTDVLAGMYLAAAMLSQQRLAAGLSLMHAAGVLRGRRVHAEQAEPADTASAASQCLPEDQTAAGMPAGAGMATGAQHMQAEGRHPGQGRPSANGLGANGKSGEHAGQPTEVAIPIGDNEEAFWVWLRGICQRPKFLLEPPARAALAVPNLRCDAWSAAHARCRLHLVPKDPMYMLLSFTPGAFLAALGRVWEAAAAAAGSPNVHCPLALATALQPAAAGCRLLRP